MGHCFEKAMVEQCAPTLAGVKVGSLFRIAGLSSARASAVFWDQTLSPLGVRVMVLKECPAADACMIYVYREKWLGRLLAQKAISDFLSGIGYDTTEGVGMLSLLSRRFCLEQEYPHEIGVFLGYPRGLHCQSWPQLHLLWPLEVLWRPRRRPGTLCPLPRLHR